MTFGLWEKFKNSGRFHSLSSRKKNRHEKSRKTLCFSIFFVGSGKGVTPCLLSSCKKKRINSQNDTVLHSCGLTIHFSSKQNKQQVDNDDVSYMGSRHPSSRWKCFSNVIFPSKLYQTLFGDPKLQRSPHSLFRR